MLLNYKFKYKARNKVIFVPNEDCIRKGKRLIKFVLKRFSFPPCFYHYQPGGHVVALHSHILSDFFFKIDLQNFFYSISRNRVANILQGVNFKPAGTFAKWSCVPNPYEEPKYVLPIGFIQSPLLASLVLFRSPVLAAIEKARAQGVFVSVYVDDLVGSSSDKQLLQSVYEDILKACEEANLCVNEQKIVAPADAIVAFNCDITNGAASVTETRVQKFYSTGRSEAAIKSFEEYRRRVARENIMP
jgi:Reverse transcriptase (RNA-dependent DNA polymerase)